jgi:hypothetical protein
VSELSLGGKVVRGRARTVALLGFLIIFGWLIIAIADPNEQSVPGWLVVGFILGTIFGQVSLAAAWCALGPFSLIRRLPLSFAWIAAIVIAFAVNIARSPHSNGFGVLVLYGGAVLMQWVLVQAPMWLLVARYGLRIRHQDEAATVTDHRDQQFGIRQVMILTMIVAVVLGIGRIVLGELKGGGGPTDGLMIFAFLVLTNAVIPLPVIAAALLPRGIWRATFAALLLVALATAIEVTLVWLLAKATAASELSMFALINSFHCAWILTLLHLVRRSGFRLLTKQNTRIEAMQFGEAFSAEAGSLTK